MTTRKLSYVLVPIICISTFLGLTSYSLGDLQTSQGKIFNDLYADYDFEYIGTVNSSFEYVYDSSGLYNVSWTIGTSLPGVWQEDIDTRLTSNVGGSGLNFGIGTHAPVWVFTNLTLGDTVPIAVDGIGDRDFNVTNELSINHLEFGSLDIWVLQDIVFPSRIAWYEKSTGLLLNGTFPNFLDPYNLTLTDTNMFSHYNEGVGGGIPGYSLFAVLPLTIIITLVIIRKQKRKLI
ncbi:MAG: Loki-CTERM sorting domain-containing protein [Promethearchaeota archaeon]|jgi:hypothetical protein